MTQDQINNLILESGTTLLVVLFANALIFLVAFWLTVKVAKNNQKSSSKGDEPNDSSEAILYDTTPYGESDSDHVIF